MKKNRDIQPKIIGEADHFLDKLRVNFFWPWFTAPSFATVHLQKSHNAKEKAQHELQRKETEINHVVKEKSHIMEQFQQLEGTFSEVLPG